MRPPNSRHSEPRNSHIANLLLDSPVVVWCTGPCGMCGASGAMPPWGMVASANGGELLRGAAGSVRPVPLEVVFGGRRRLEGPAVHTADDDQAADDGEQRVEDESEPDDGQAD